MLFPACYYNVSDVVWKEDWILNKTSPLLGRYIDTMMILEFAISTSCEVEIANSSNKIIHERKINMFFPSANYNPNRNCKRLSLNDLKNDLIVQKVHSISETPLFQDIIKE